ncbi:MAG: sodium/solute symporter [Archaeoglobaceae archaeon]|nr:sodium/solute symporter [Archaeoglobaceae archaeon]MDW8118254.1 sodium/solute symporter [Archaeoglobaceae archaeon]
MILEVFIAYLVLMVAIGIYEYRRTRNLPEFYIAGKKLGAFAVSFSFFATYFSTAAFLGGGGTGFLLGFQWSAFLIFFHILFAILAWLLIAPPMKRIADQHGVMTIPELFGKSFGKSAQMICALIILFFFEFYMVSIYKGAGNLLQTMLSISYVEGLLITAVIVAIYTAIGGFRAVVTTDIIQGIIMFFGAIVLFFSVFIVFGGFEALNTLSQIKPELFEFGKLGPKPVVDAGMVVQFVLSLTFAISIAQLSSPQLVVRFIAAKDQRVIGYGMILTPIIIGIFAICVFSIGPFGWLVIPKEEIPSFLKDVDRVVPYIAMKMLPVGVNALLLTAIIAAAMSTINSLVHVSATALVRDLLQNFIKISDSKALKLTRLAVPILALIPIAFAVKPPDIIVGIVGVSFSIITSAFLIPLLALLYSKSVNPRAAVASMIIAVAVCVVWQVYFYPKFFTYPVIPGLIASAITYFAFNLKKKH